MNKKTKESFIGRELAKLGFHKTSIDGDKYVVVEQEDSVTYKQLDILAVFFNTDLINISSEVRNGGSCESCSFDYAVNLITIGPLNLSEEAVLKLTNNKKDET